MSVHEEELPGIGRKFEITVAKGDRIDVVIHHSGRRDLYIFERDDEDPRTVMKLTDDQARRLGAVLSGAYFKPAVVEEIEALIGEFVVDWITLTDESPATGKSLAELEVRKRTGMSVISIIRTGATIKAPDPNEVLRSGDRLVVVGPQRHFNGFLGFMLG
ncbi:MAG: cation:proton antiporter regulatory subunit [Actinomycetota bacterium]